MVLPGSVNEWSPLQWAHFLQSVISRLLITEPLLGSPRPGSSRLCMSTNFWSTVVYSFLFLMVLLTLKLLPLPGKTPASYIYSHCMYSHVFILINGNISLDDLERQQPVWQTPNVKNKRFKGACREERRQKEQTCNRRLFLIDVLWPQKERKGKKKDLTPTQTFWNLLSSHLFLFLHLALPLPPTHIPLVPFPNRLSKLSSSAISPEKNNQLAEHFPKTPTPEGGSAEVELKLWVRVGLREHLG